MNDSECKNSVIKRQAALNTVKEMFKACEGDLETYRDLMIACMLDLPEAQPEIIHCRDCTHFCRAEGEESDWCYAWGNVTNEDAFCSYAEGEPMRLIDADELKTAFPCGESVRTECVRATIDNMATIMPPAQPEQTQMIKEIRKWINSGNRGSADYFIVDQIEEIINKYER